MVKPHHDVVRSLIASIESETGPVDPIPGYCNVCFKIVTPRMARSYLRRTNKNRPVATSHVLSLEREISNGHWRYNGAAIRFTAGGELIDGQHRLLACIIANKSIETNVAFGLPEDAFQTIDTIARPRSSGDILAIAGFGRGSSHRTLAAAARLAIAHVDGTMDWSLAQRARSSPSRILNFVSQQPRLVEIAEHVHAHHFRLEQLLTSSTAIFCWWAIDRLDRDKAEQFMLSLEGGAGLSPDDPIFLLRDRLLRERMKHFGKGLTSSEVIALTFRAWNAWAIGDKRVYLPKHSKEFPKLAAPKSAEEGLVRSA